MNHTLATLLDGHDQIRIPKLQRDFAQGRPGAERIRERFLRALRDALVPAAGGSLDLDFIYGTTNDGAFSPLDGQQRLTTLFLLHWYLAHRDARVEEFRTLFVDKDGHSRFTYDVRPTAGEFFDALVQASPDLDVPTPLSHQLRDARWYFQSWERDPTVVSCLSVLDTIHALFGDLQNGFDRLTDTADPRITFQFLDLEAFGLTDDLYIKMNARGKPLTELETFKAHLEQHIARHHRDLTVADGPLGAHLSHAFDTGWADLFWKHRDAEDNSYDVQMMRAIVGVALLGWDGEESSLQALLDGRVRTFYDFREQGCLNEAFLVRLVTLFDRLSVSPGDLWRTAGRMDGGDLMSRLFEGRSRGPRAMTYGHWVQWIAWCEYLLTDRPIAGLEPWMRVVSNLADNTIYNRLPEFISSLRAIRALVDHEDIEAHLRDPSTEVSGFNRQQIREERLKAVLMHRHAEWKPRILAAEDHPYFRGQIEFLLVFCGVMDRWLEDASAGWSDEDDQQLRDAFDDWWKRAISIFPARKSGLFDHRAERWRRALLCEGDYPLAKGRNWSLLDDTDREASWKRLLRGDLKDEDANAGRQLVASLLAKLDLDDVEGSLEARISEGVDPDEEEASDPGEHAWDWRDCLVERPELFRYMDRNLMRFGEDETVFLLGKSQRNGRHWDLYVNWLGLWAREQLAAGALSPFDSVEMDPVITASVRPRLILQASEHPTWRIEVTHKDERFRLWLCCGEEKIKSVKAAGPKAKTALVKLAAHPLDES